MSISDFKDVHWIVFYTWSMIKNGEVNGHYSYFGIITLQKPFCIAVTMDGVTMDTVSMDALTLELS